ncbi:PD-(D/E)XK nuclease family protein [bacterium]|nr:PD-(D/E)XK nuclease family protein [bacterium]
MSDKYSATWISHSSISDYLACPRAYYLKNVYKDPQTRHKLQIVSPSLSLGIAVHDILENLSTKKSSERFQESLVAQFERHWPQFTGEKGGFTSESLEKTYHDRGLAMLQRVMNHPGPLTGLAVKIKADLPEFWLSEDENIILCGKLDWLTYHPEDQTVTIIDFKTSKTVENESSLQLPIYLLLATYCQKYHVRDAAYWYLELHDELTPKPLPSLADARAQLLDIGRRIATARKLQAFKCPHGGCPHCEPFERILRGEGKLVGSDDKMRRDSYLLSWKHSPDDTTEEIL